MNLIFFHPLLMTFNSYIRRIKRKNCSLKFVVIGLDNSGKTTIINKIFKKETIVSPTFGYSINHFTYANKNICLIDVGGQESLRYYWSNFFEDIDGVLFIFDIFDRRDFVEELNNVRKILHGYPFLLLGNKIDIDKQLALSILENVRKKVNCSEIFCHGVSGITGDGLESAINEFIGYTSKKIQCNILV